MKLAGLMSVRNEDWILGLSARVALLWCDVLVILNHASTDGTADIISDLLWEYGPSRVAPLKVDGPWAEMEHRQYMLDAARFLDAAHIAIIDADEVLTGNLITVDDPLSNDTPLRRSLNWMPRGSILQLPCYNLRGSINRCHSNGLWGNRWISVAFADDPILHWQGDKFHSREPAGLELCAYRPIKHGQGGVMHLWGASERRLRAKHSWYKLTERLRWPQRPVAEIDAMYSWAIKGGLPKTETAEQWTYADVPAEWWQPYAQWAKYLDVDAEPWQEAECRRLVAEHGAAKFAGLDLFGVA